MPIQCSFSAQPVIVAFKSIRSSLPAYMLGQVAPPDITHKCRDAATFSASAWRCSCIRRLLSSRYAYKAVTPPRTVCDLNANDFLLSVTAFLASAPSRVAAVIRLHFSLSWQLRRCIFPIHHQIPKHPSVIGCFGPYSLKVKPVRPVRDEAYHAVSCTYTKTREGCYKQGCYSISTRKTHRGLRDASHGVPKRYESEQTITESGKKRKMCRDTAATRF